MNSDIFKTPERPIQFQVIVINWLWDCFWDNYSSLDVWIDQNQNQLTYSWDYIDGTTTCGKWTQTIKICIEKSLITV